jgi:hypothetical protein
MVALLAWLETYPPQDIQTLAHVNQQELRQSYAPEILQVPSSQINEFLNSDYNPQYFPPCTCVLHMIVNGNSRTVTRPPTATSAGLASRPWCYVDCRVSSSQSIQ